MFVLTHICMYVHMYVPLIIIKDMNVSTIGDHGGRSEIFFGSNLDLNFGQKEYDA